LVSREDIPNLDVFGAMLVVIEVLGGGFEVCLGGGSPLTRRARMLAGTGALLFDLTLKVSVIEVEIANLVE